MGTPYETREDVEDKVRLSRRYPIQEVHFYNTIPYPGTELYDWVEENNCFIREPGDYLNDVSCLTSVPVFETPELPGKERIEVLNYLGKVRQQVHRDAVSRTFRKRKVIGVLAGYVLANRFVERLFYQSIFWRRIIEGFRYRLAISK